MSRERGGSSVTSRSPIVIEPPEVSSSPAIIRRSVDLPQPDGPTRTRNSPLSISRETASTATTSPPKTFVTRSSTISATAADLYRTGPDFAMALTTFRERGYSSVRDGGRSTTEGDEAECNPAAGAGPDRAPRRRHRDPLGAPAERRSRRLAAYRPRGPRRPRARGLRRPPARERHLCPA